MAAREQFGFAQPTIVECRHESNDSAHRKGPGLTIAKAPNARPRIDYQSGFAKCIIGNVLPLH
jgi:hypothetical protein